MVPIRQPENHNLKGPAESRGYTSGVLETNPVFKLVDHSDLIKSTQRDSSLEWKRVCAVYYTGGSMLPDNMQPLMSKEDIKGTHLNDPKAQAARAAMAAESEPVRLAQQKSNYRRITIAESCRQAAGPCCIA
jgi:hypothetical protein